jgi:hypothetical protein
MKGVHLEMSTNSVNTKPAAFYTKSATGRKIRASLDYAIWDAKYRSKNTTNTIRRNVPLGNSEFLFVKNHFLAIRSYAKGVARMYCLSLSEFNLASSVTHTDILELGFKVISKSQSASKSSPSIHTAVKKASTQNKNQTPLSYFVGTVIESVKHNVQNGELPSRKPVFAYAVTVSKDDYIITLKQIPAQRKRINEALKSHGLEVKSMILICNNLHDLNNYGRLDLEIDLIGNQTVIEKPKIRLTATEIYEKNKSSDICVGCGKPTIEKAVFSSLISYCTACSG